MNKTPRLAISTRFRRNDYKYAGDVSAFEEFKNKYKEHDFHNLIDTTKPVVLLWDEQIYVTGIQTSRKDIINTRIRYSFFLESPEASTLFDCLKAELQKEQKELKEPEEQRELKWLGNILDKKLFKFDDWSNALPEQLSEKEKEFVDIIKDLPKTSDGTETLSKRRIWTMFQPVRGGRDEIQNFINGLKIPEDFEIQIEGFAPPFFKGKGKTNSSEKKTFLKRWWSKDFSKNLNISSENISATASRLPSGKESSTNSRQSLNISKNAAKWFATVLALVVLIFLFLLIRNPKDEISKLRGELNGKTTALQEKITELIKKELTPTTDNIQKKIDTLNDELKAIKDELQKKIDILSDELKATKDELQKKIDKLSNSKATIDKTAKKEKPIKNPTEKKESLR